MIFRSIYGCSTDEFPNPPAKKQAAFWVVLWAKQGKIRFITKNNYVPNFSIFST